MSSQPKHLAIIMDGNGRWATQRNRPRVFGHIKGARVAKKIITECSHRNMQSLTLYAFSAENWLRPKTEVQFLMRLLHRHIKKERTSLVEKNVIFKCIGEIQHLPENVQKELSETIAATKNNTGMVLTFALSYGGRQEITSAVKKIAQQLVDKKIEIENIDQELIGQNLQTYPCSDPDLIIRTSGESRLSNFLLWQAAYSELYFTDRLWPDFSITDLEAAFAEFGSRERRYGLVKNLTTSSDSDILERPTETSL